jgi:ferrochelatase
LAVVLFNLGGPDSPEAIQPFLFNLFNDPAIIGAPKPIRWALAKYISGKRAPKTKAIYENLGGKSPLLDLTQDQARALRETLVQDGEQSFEDVEVFVAMRYWHPFAKDVARDVKAFSPDLVVLLPLYPQYSMTTSRSSIEDWHRSAAAVGLEAPTREVCCYFQDPSFIAGHVDLLRKQLDGFGEDEKVRVLFSAHGLPVSVIEKGDPYQWQIEQTVDAIVKGLDRPELDYVVCYQSRVTREEWLGPSTQLEIERAAEDEVAVVVVPVAFVSEHSETLVELDIQYRDVAKDLNVPRYERIPALGVHHQFVGAMHGLVCQAAELDSEQILCAGREKRCCPQEFGQCPLATES